MPEKVIDKKKKDKKFVAGPKRKSYIKHIAKVGSPSKRSPGVYSKTGDVDPRLVYDEPTVDYRGNTYDQDGYSAPIYGTAVFRTTGNTYFMYNNELWQTDAVGSNAAKVNI